METTLRIGGTSVHLIGSIPGFVPDAARVQAALTAEGPSCLALGVPPEDLAGLAALAAGATIAKPSPKLSNAATPATGAPGPEAILGAGEGTIAYAKSDSDFEALDPTQQRFLDLLGAWGETRIPSPDLDVAHHWATENHVPLEALDLDDEAHASVYIKANRFRDVLRSGRILKRIVKHEFSDTDPHAFATSWDDFLNALPSLQKVEEARETQMAERLRELARVHQSIVAIIPAPRFAGVRDRLAA